MDDDEEVESSLRKYELGGLQEQTDSESETESGQVENAGQIEAVDGEHDGEPPDASSGSEDIEPFNLDDEREEGNFQDGAFVRTEKGDAFDSWLGNVDKAAIRRARTAKSAQEKLACKSTLSEEQALERLGPLLNPAETAMEVIESSQDGSRVEGITIACNALLSSIPNVYDLEREELARMFQSKFGRNFKRKRVADNWKFKWPGQEEVHGPFTAMEMQTWLDHGYFKTGVQVCPADGDEFRDISEVSF